MKQYVYGMRLRGFSPGAQPSGVDHRENGGRKYWDIIVYNRELTKKEMRVYNLDFIEEKITR